MSRLCEIAHRDRSALVVREGEREFQVTTIERSEPHARVGRMTPFAPNGVSKSILLALFDSARSLKKEDLRRAGRDEEAC